MMVITQNGEAKAVLQVESSFGAIRKRIEDTK
jgi:hypothetical protein